jgi:histone deacetylase HOS3
MMYWFSSGTIIRRISLLRSYHIDHHCHSSGFDASEYETEDMSRHGRNVPTAFYHRFTRDACKFSDNYANGRLISVLEGGYSDKALISGALAHVTALADMDGLTDRDWWNPKCLDEVSV